MQGEEAQELWDLKEGSTCECCVITLWSDDFPTWSARLPSAVAATQEWK